MTEIRLLPAVLEDTAQASQWYDDKDYRHHNDWIVISLVIHAARSPRLLRKLLRERGPQSP